MLVSPVLLTNLPDQLGAEFFQEALASCKV
jgi:hypothetical protein